MPVLDRMVYMQFTAIVLMTILVVKLMLLPRKALMDPVVGKARWLMLVGIALLDAQFLLQYKLQLRAMGVTQAVMFNLAFFIPASAFLSLGVLALERQGKIQTYNKYFLVPVWIVAMGMMIVAYLTSDKALLSDSPQMRWAEVGASICYAAMQLHFTAQHLVELRRMHQALASYYDGDMAGLLKWMEYSVIVLAVIALLVPVLIFGSGKWLAVYGLFSFISIYYFIDSFYGYVVSSAPRKVYEAERSEEELMKEEVRHERTASPDYLQRVQLSVEQWVAKGGHLRSGINCPTAADEMRLPRYQLSAWLKHHGHRYNDWLAELRIEEAKKVMQQHPDWSNESVALHCGFSDRSYFQTIFKKITGMTPSEFQQQQR